ncbi:MAG: tRNA (adenosine(37)-N6)-threonylcarbamoyltransferase complex ATPase subunit type 1 TsaE [Patescibacteria group bacterium]
MGKIAKADLGNVVKEVLAKIPLKEGRLGRAALITLSGDLGAGKTTFVQALARELGIERVVQSPTYVLMKSYELKNQAFTKLVHIDAYRLNNGDEFAALEPASFLLDEDALVCVEWPERIEGALPRPDVALKLSADPPAGEAGGAGEEERYILIDSE